MVYTKAHFPILWVGPWVPSDSFDEWRAASPAARKWQAHLLRALVELGALVYPFYYRPEPVWPKGRLFPAAYKRDSLPPGRKPIEISYINAHLLRPATLERGARVQLARHWSTTAEDGVIFTYNSPSWIQKAVKKHRAVYDCRWIAIVADGEAPSDADGYVFLSHYSYLQSRVINKMHLDGGVYPIKRGWPECGIDRHSGPKKFLYSGTLTRWGGIDTLLEAIELINRSDFEVIITGPAPRGEVQSRLLRETRVDYRGLIDSENLLELMDEVDVFINPRPTKIRDGEKNFPSKLLDYLGWKKPILSTWTDGLSPEYQDALTIFEDDSGSLAQAIIDILDGSHEPKIPEARWLSAKTWEKQASRLLDFLDPV